MVMAFNESTTSIDNKSYRSKVSIITPMYNASAFILATAESILSQTYDNFQWIVVDDCSTDNCVELLKQYIKDDPRVEIILLKQNSGPIIARNRALENVKGRFVAFCDADDLWLPSKLEKQIDFMLNNKTPLSYTAFKKIDTSGKLKNGKLMKVPKRVSYRDTLRTDSIVASSAVYDTEITGSLKQCYDAPIGKDDYQFFLHILENYGDAMGLQEDLMRLRIHNESLTGNKLVSARRQWNFYYHYLDLSLVKSIYYFIFYAYKGFMKYIK